MLIIVLAVCTVLSLLNLILFHGGLLLSILALVFGLAGIVLKILKVGISDKVAGFLSVVCLAVCAVCLWNTETRAQENGILYYQKQLDKALDQIDKKDLDAATKTVSDLEEIYGADDNTLMLRAMKELGNNNYDDAYENMKSVTDKTSQMYYAVMEQIYIADPSENSVERIYDLYLEAAKEWPGWTYMQKYAGITQFEKGLYEGAEYYLLRAYKQDGSDARTCYYLGAVNYYLEDYEDSVAYFKHSVDLGADEQTQRDIYWYIKQMQQEEL